MKVDVLKSSLGHLVEVAVVLAAGLARELSYLYVLSVLQRRLQTPALVYPAASGARTRCRVRDCFQGRERVCLRDYSICVKYLSSLPFLGSLYDCDLRSRSASSVERSISLLYISSLSARTEVGYTTHLLPDLESASFVKPAAQP